MKVRKLIKLLEKEDPNKEIKVWSEERFRWRAAKSLNDGDANSGGHKGKKPFLWID